MWDRHGVKREREAGKGGRREGGETNEAGKKGGEVTKRVDRNRARKRMKKEEGKKGKRGSEIEMGKEKDVGKGKT